MNFAKIFIDRPILATVLSFIVMIMGGLAYFTLPVEQYPQVVPPTIQVIATYPGATPKTIADTVATPIEQEISGIENMVYMSSQSTNDGKMTLAITFELGTDLNVAQNLVQNRVALAEPRLPEKVRKLGITTQKSTPDLMLVINLYSPDGTYDWTYIGNYAVLNIRDRIRRIDGVGGVRLSGASEYAMRIWLNPDLIQSYGMTAEEVIGAVRGQNVQIASGGLNRLPQSQPNYYEHMVQTPGRLTRPEEFGNIIIKTGRNSRIVRLKDVARIELGAQNYSTQGHLRNYPAVALLVEQRPDSNALKTADAILKEMEEISKNFPEGLKHEIAYNPTRFIGQSIDAVKYTVYEAIALVVIVIIVFLQTWRAAIIPIIAIPVSIIGTFAVMAAFGFSLNNLTLFGLVLAIGIVVDDAIVVVENMERNIRAGLSPKQAARKTMDEVGSALIAMGLVLLAVFLPSMLLEGISGKFYQAFGITIAVATVISVFVSLTLSPALAGILMKADDNPEAKNPESLFKNPLKSFFVTFNKGMGWLSEHYGKLVGKLIQIAAVMIVIYAGLMAFTLWQFNSVPRGFIPEQDQGYFIVSIQLPSGAMLSKTDTVVEKAIEKIMKIEGVINTVGYAGFSGATRTISSNSAAVFAILDSFENRALKNIAAEDILTTMRREMASIKEAFIVVIKPPAVRGIGQTGGFSMVLQDRSGRGLDVLNKTVWAMAGAARSHDNPAVSFATTFFENNTPQVYLDIDRERAEKLNVPASRISEALEVYIGSVFVNDFNYLGRTFHVTAQADAPYRLEEDDLFRIKVRSNNGKMVPIGSIATLKNDAGPSRVQRYNLYPAIELRGFNAPGYSTGEAISTMEKLAQTILPDGIGYEWTGIAHEEKAAGNTAIVAFILAVVFVFLLLAAQYESWTLPLSIVLIVPMCLSSALTGVVLAGMDNNILTQVGFVVLVGLASKNAILIVEFARELEHQGYDRLNAAIKAAKLRLRPILMTFFSFVLGVVPLVFAHGAGAEMRLALGVTVFSGMLGVTFFGLIFTPVFYVYCRKLAFLRSHEKRTKIVGQRKKGVVS